MAKTNLTPGVIELDDSTLVDTKEHIRLDQIIPSEILHNKTKLREFLEAYYTFMNMEEFIYQETKVFEDIVLDNVARFRVQDSTRNNEFFVDSGAGNSTLVLKSPTGKTPAKFIFDGSSSSLVSASDDTIEVGVFNQQSLPVGTPVVYKSGDGSAINGLTNNFTYYIISSAGGKIKLSTSVNGNSVDIAGVGTGVLHSFEGANSTMTIPISSINTAISNGNELPGSLQLTSGIGKTFTVTNLTSFNGYTATLTTLIKRYVGPGPSNIMNTIEKAMNIDTNDDSFLTMMQKEIGASLPRNTVGNRRTLYKLINDFYKLRGSSDSIEIFFRLLFNEEVEVEFPYEKTLIPSQGDWDQALNHTTTLSSAASNTNVINITASNDNIRPGSKIVDGTPPGSTITLKDGIADSVEDNPVTVSSVDATGKVITLSQAITLSSGATVTFVPRGTYLDQRGFLSYDQVITDSKKFQKFSYLVKTGRSLQDWENAFDKLVHPAGFIYFAEILIFLQLTKSALGEDALGDGVRNDGLAPILRKVLSALPTRQPGVIGIEDLPLLVEAFASIFSPIAEAKIHKSGSLSLNLRNGVISGSSITSGGTGYTSAPTITTSDSAAASGFNAATLTASLTNGRVSAITIVNGGSEYGTPVATFSAPTAMTFNPATAVNLSNDTITLTTAQAAALNNGDIVTYNSGGGTSIGNLTSTISYKVVNKSGNNIKLELASNPAGAINLSSVGSGTSHTLTGTTATATLSKTDGTVKAIEITEKGFGYSGTQTVSFNGTAQDGVTPTNPAATIGVTSDGELDVDAITISNTGAGFSQLFATVPANPNATKIAKIKVLGPSQKNFRTAPGITFPPPDAVDAEGIALSTNVTAAAVFTLDSNGFITSGDITPSNPGLGYTRDPLIRLASGAHNEIRVRTQHILDLSLNHNNVKPTTSILHVPKQTTGSLLGGNLRDDIISHVDSITITNAGSGYTSATVSFSGGLSSVGSTTAAEATATVSGGQITAITITNQGDGYVSAPTITISGDGSNAAATATIDDTYTRTEETPSNAKFLPAFDVAVKNPNFRTIINNGYKQRKGQNFYTSSRLYNSNQQISFLGDIEIQNVDSTNINKYNTRTFVDLE